MWQQSERCPLALPPPRWPQVTPAGGERGAGTVPLNSILCFASPPSPCNNYSRAVAPPPPPPPAPRGLPSCAQPISARPRHSEGNETRRKGKKKFGEERAGPAGAAGPAQVRERGGAGAGRAGPGWAGPSWALGCGPARHRRGAGGRRLPAHRPRGAAEGLWGGSPPFAPPTPVGSGRGARGSFSAFFGGSVPPVPTPGGRLRAQEPSRGRGVCTRVLGWKREAEPALGQRCAGRAGPRALRSDPGGSAPGFPRCPRWAQRSGFGWCGHGGARESMCSLCCAALVVKARVNACTVCRTLAFCFMESYCCCSGLRPGALWDLTQLAS